MVAQVPDIFTFDEGFYNIFPEVEEQARWMDWYRLNYDTLLPRATISNAGLLYDRETDMIRDPIFRMTSDFLRDACLADMPHAHTTDAGAQAWLDENERMISRALLISMGHWSVYGWGVLAAEDGPNGQQIYAVDPLLYFRVGDIYQDDEFVGHILAMPTRVPDAASNEEDIPQVYRALREAAPNRIRIIRQYRTAEGDVQVWERTYHYSPSRVIGRPAGPDMISPIKRICTFGIADGFYAALKDTAAHIIEQKTMMRVDINRFRNQPLYIGAGMGNALREAYNAEQIALGNKTTADLMSSRASLRDTREAVRNTPWPVAVLAQDEITPAVMMERLELTGVLAELQIHIDTFYMVSGVPPSAFGINIGRGESGEARDKATAGAKARIDSVRKDIGICLPRLCAAAGMPAGEVTFRWLAPPFQDMAAIQELVLAQLTAGIIDATEARNRIGIPGNAPAPTPDETAPGAAPATR